MVWLKKVVILLEKDGNFFYSHLTGMENFDLTYCKHQNFMMYLLLD